jgi:hypothetical protein
MITPSKGMGHSLTVPRRPGSCSQFPVWRYP